MWFNLFAPNRVRNSKNYCYHLNCANGLMKIVQTWSIITSKLSISLLKQSPCHFAQMSLYVNNSPSNVAVAFCIISSRMRISWNTSRLIILRTPSFVVIITRPKRPMGRKKNRKKNGFFVSQYCRLYLIIYWLRVTTNTLIHTPSTLS